MPRRSQQPFTWEAPSLPSKKRRGTDGKGVFPGRSEKVKGIHGGEVVKDWEKDWGKSGNGYANLEGMVNLFHDHLLVSQGI